MNTPEQIEKNLGKKDYRLSFPLCDDVFFEIVKMSDTNAMPFLIDMNTKTYIYCFPVMGSLRDYDDTLQKLIHGEVSVSLEKREQSVYEGVNQPITNTQILTSEEDKDKCLSELQSMKDSKYAILQYLSTTSHDEKKNMEDGLSRASKRDRELILNLDHTIQEVEEMENYVDFTKLLQWSGRLMNLFKFGELNKTIKQNINVYARRNIGWSLLNYCAEISSTELEDDAKYLSSMGDSLSKSIREMSVFYGNLAEFSYYGKKRTENLLERSLNIYSRTHGVKEPPVQRIYDKAIRDFPHFVFSK